jgi:hypothetical protein
MLLTLPTARWRLLATTAAAALAVAACASEPRSAPPAARILVTPQSMAVGAGAAIDVEYQIASLARAAAIPAGSWVFVHMVDAGGALLWTDDHQPMSAPAAGSDTPVVYRRTMFVPRTTPAGRVRIEAGLFIPANGARIPTAPGNPATAGFEVARDTSGLFVVFGDGWHAAERVEQRQASEWRWSKGDARLSFRHPQRDVELTIELDQPVASVGPQTAELRVGSDLLATLEVDPGVRRIHRVPLPAARLGGGPMVELNLHVQPTFVPASTAGLTSADARELGVRVFNVHVGFP